MAKIPTSQVSKSTQSADKPAEQPKVSAEQQRLVAAAAKLKIGSY